MSEMKSFYIRIIPLLSFIIVGYLVPSASSQYALYTNDSKPYGTAYGEWIGKWWIWWIGIPNNLHPVNDYSDPKRCSVMQHGPVWFLPDVVTDQEEISQNCTIPNGKAVLLPITTSICERGIEGNLTDNELAHCADNILTPINNIIVKVDGKNVDVSKSNVKTAFFNVTFPENPVGIFGMVKPGTYKGKATGYFLFLHDLSPGKHVIDLRVVDLLKGTEGLAPIFEPPRQGIFKINVQ
jgi:hypothetical protein